MRIRTIDAYSFCLDSTAEAKQAGLRELVALLDNNLSSLEPDLSRYQCMKALFDTVNVDITAAAIRDVIVGAVAIFVASDSGAEAAYRKVSDAASKAGFTGYRKSGYDRSLTARAVKDWYAEARRQGPKGNGALMAENAKSALKANFSEKPSAKQVQAFVSDYLSTAFRQLNPENLQKDI